jgi:hypothetical protein
MPAKTKKQLKFMYAVKEGKIKGGPSKKVADEIINKTSKSKKHKLMMSE